MSDVQVIGLPQSNYVWAVRIALAEKGVDHENVPAPPHSPEAVAVHPMGKVPVLRHGGVALGESRAIIDYIDATFDGAPFFLSNATPRCAAIPGRRSSRPRSNRCSCANTSSPLCYRARLTASPTVRSSKRFCPRSRLRLTSWRPLSGRARLAQTRSGASMPISFRSSSMCATCPKVAQ